MERLADDTWILMENRMKIIIIFLVVAVFACTVGILLALLLGYVFLKPISKLDPNGSEATKNTVSNECVDNTDNTAEGVTQSHD